MNVFTITFVLFLGLKLAHVIDWSWLWVTAPLWLGAAFVIIMALIGLLIALVAAVIAKR